MTYTKTVWEDDVTPLSATNMNHIEDGIVDSFSLGEQNLINILTLKLQVALAESGINAWADLLADATGINAAASSSNITVTGGVVKADSTLDLCTGGTPISGGYTTYDATKAFDDNDTTFWLSLQTGTAISGAAYIGYDFGAQVTISSFTLKTYANTNNNISSVKLQKSDNGSSWADVETFALATTADTLNTKTLASAATARYFRLLANANLGAGEYWSVREITMKSSSCSVVWDAVTADKVLTNAAITAKQTLNGGTATWYISDDGTSWTETDLDTIQAVDFAATSVYLKVALTGAAEVDAVAWGGY